MKKSETEMKVDISTILEINSEDEGQGSMDYGVGSMDKEVGSGE